MDEAGDVDTEAEVVTVGDGDGEGEDRPGFDNSTEGKATPSFGYVCMCSFVAVLFCGLSVVFSAVLPSATVF
jgi:hypothetical protein